MKRRNMFKGTMVMALAGAMAAGMAMTSFAAGWQKNDTGWWYGTNADNTTWHANGWQWIDSNNDGVAECYYFDANGYMLANTTTPDGYTVNADGAWTENGVAHTRQTGTQSQETGTNTALVTDNGGYNEYGCSNVALDMVTHTREENAKYGEVSVSEFGNATSVYYSNGFRVYYQYINDNYTDKELWIDPSRTDLDDTYLFKHYDPSLSNEEMVQKLVGMGWEHGNSGLFAHTGTKQNWVASVKPGGFGVGHSISRNDTGRLGLK